MPEDLVNSPAHYTGHPTGVECVEITEHAKDPNIAAAFKYLWRVEWGNKFGGEHDVQDFRKAIWFIEREIKRRTKDTEPEQG